MDKSAHADGESTRAQDPKEVLTVHLHSAYRGKLKFFGDHQQVCSSIRRTRRLDEGAEVDPVGDPSGCFDEGLHEVLELKLLCVGHLKCLQLVLFGLLAMDPDE